MWKSAETWSSFHHWFFWGQEYAFLVWYSKPSVDNIHIGISLSINRPYLAPLQMTKLLLGLKPLLSPPFRKSCQVATPYSNFANQQSWKYAFQIQKLPVTEPCLFSCCDSWKMPKLQRRRCASMSGGQRLCRVYCRHSVPISVAGSLCPRDYIYLYLLVPIVSVWVSGLACLGRSYFSSFSIRSTWVMIIRRQQ